MGVPSRRRQAQDEVAEAARRRLELLARELDRAGLRRLEPDGRDPRTTAELEDELGDELRDELRDEPGGESGEARHRVRDPGRWDDPAALDGVLRPARADGVDEGLDDLPLGRPVPPAGRHLRTAPPGVLSRAGDWVADQVPDTFRGRAWLGAGPAALVVGFVVLALGITAVVVLRSGDRGELVSATAGRPPAATSKPLVDAAAGPGAIPSAGATGPAAAGATSGTAASGAPTPGASGGATVTVDVAGKVRRPGVATLPAGSRVVDAVRRAGGARGRVDLSALNLARVLVDGEQILVGVAGTSTTGGAAAAGAAAGSVAGGATGAPPAGALVNLNTATLDQLDTLPGVGPVTAQKILDWRTAHGAFSSVDELLEVDGIGDKTLADLAPHATL